MSDLESLFEQMIGSKIDAVGIEDEEFVLLLDNGIKIILFSDEDLQIYYELGESKH